MRKEQGTNYEYFVYPRDMQFRQHPERFVRHIVSAPFIYGMLVPAIFLDLCLEIYHHICFRLYGLPLIERDQYIRVDRHRLSYLNWYEKINCLYCGYMNGLFFYISKIAAETENYWCGIKHERIEGMKEQPHHKDFLPYGDKEAFDKAVVLQNKK